MATNLGPQRSGDTKCSAFVAAMVPFGLATACLIWVALFNGFPTVFPDTIKYLGTARTLIATWDRPPFYGWWIWLLVGRGSLWPVVVLQAACTVALLWLTFRAVVGARRWAFVGVVALLAALTSLPWFASQIMCDFATAFVPLGLFLLAACYGRLTVVERGFVAAMVVFATLINTSHLLLAIALLSAFAIARAFGTKQFSCRGIALFCGAVMAGLVTVMATNMSQFGGLTVAPGSAAFTLDRMLSDGVGGAYLDRHCSERNYALCRYRNQLPTPPGWLLWSYDSPLWTVWGTGDSRQGATRAAFETAAVEAAQPELQEIVTGALREFPMTNLARMVEGGLLQLFLMPTGDGMEVHGRFPALAWELADRSPEQLSAFRSSRQDRNALHIPLFIWLDLAALCVCIPVLWVGMRAPERRPSDVWQLFAITILLAYVANAAICGGLSGPAGRYQSRLVWLIDLAAVLSLLRDSLPVRYNARGAASVGLVGRDLTAEESAWSAGAGPAAQTCCGKPAK